MKNKWKTGILLLTLAIPVFIWLFLKSFGHNSFDIPIYYSEGIDSIADCNDGQQPHSLPSFSFNKASGGTLTDHDFEGKIVISYFMPANCTDSCELVLESLASLQNIFSEKEKLKIVVFSNEQYTLSELKDLEKRYDADPKRWNFVIGDDEKIHQLKRCGFVLSSFPTHTLILTDAERRIRGYYQAADLEEVDRLKGEVKILYYMQDVAYHD